MEQNKFWLVWNEKDNNVGKKRFETKELAYNEARKLASLYPQNTYYVLLTEASFKANVDVIETNLISSEIKETNLIETFKPKFKIDDKVFMKKDNIEVFVGNVFEIKENSFIFNMNAFSAKFLEQEKTTYEISFKDIVKCEENKVYFSIT